MKSTTLIFGLTFLLPAISLSQAAGDSTKPRQRQQSHRLADENGDGIRDRMPGRQQRLGAGMDRFIDLDGDGICDGREGGLGFRRGKTQVGNEPGKMSGRKGQGGR